MSENDDLQPFIDKYLNHKDDKEAVPIDIKTDDRFVPIFSEEKKEPLSKEAEPAPGLLGTIGLSMGRESSIGKFVSSVNEQQEDTSPLYEPYDANWNPKSNPENLIGIRKHYQGYILGASGAQDQRRRYYRALDMQEDEDYYNRGSLAGHLIGGSLAYTIGSPEILIPFGLSLKYAGLSADVIGRAGLGVANIVGGSLAHEAWIQAHDRGGNLEEAVDNAFNDMVAGIAFMGAGEGLGFGFTGVKLWNARRVLDMTQNGIDAVPLLAEDGSTIKYQAKSNSASAEEVAIAQAFLDSEMAKSGLFAIPYMGNLLGKGSGVLNPIVRGLNSPFKTMRGYVNAMASHGIETEANLKDIPSPIKFEDIVDDHRGAVTNMTNQMRALYLERNGIETSSEPVGYAKKVISSWKNPEHVTEQQFQSEIDNVMRTAIPSKHAVVNEAAAMQRKFVNEPFIEYKQLYGFTDEILPPRTSEDWLMRVYNTNEMLQREDDWVKMVSTSLGKQNETIEALTRPIDELKLQVKLREKEHLNYVQQSGLTNEQIKASSDHLMAMKRELKRKKDNLQNQLRSNPKLNILIEDPSALSANEAKQLRKLLKPIKDANKLLEKNKSDIESAKFELLKIKDKIGKSKDATAAKKLSKSHADLEKNISVLEKESAELKRKISDHQTSLDDKAHAGQMPSHFYEKDGNVIKFKNPKDRLKLRKHHGDLEARRNSAKAYYDTILNQSAEDTIDQVLGKLTGRMPENSLKERSLLIPDEDFVNSGFLSMDLMANVSNYRMMLARKIALKRTFQDVTPDGSIEPIIENLQREFQDMKGEINNKIAELKSKPQNKKTAGEIKKLESKRQKLQKQFNSAKVDMNLFHNKAMGKTRGTEAQRNFARIARNFAVSVKLGATPLTMITDLMAIPMKHGIWPTVRDGIIPFLSNIGNLVKQGKGSHYQENAKHALVGINNNLAATADRNWNSSSQPFTPLAGKISNATQNLAHVTNTIAGTNMIDNAFQRISANIIQSKIMTYMMDHVAGKLSPKDKSKLLIYGLDPEKWSKRMVDAWKRSGEDKNSLGGINSNYWTWADKEASNELARVIRVGTKDTVIRRGMFDAPFALDDPWFGTLFMFKGWIAASFTRYTMPLMQKPDAEKILGSLLMLTTGAMVTPLRRIAKGEDPIQDDDHMFRNALIDGGIVSGPMDLLEMANGLSGGLLLPENTNDKYRDRSIAGYLAGPLGSIGNDLQHIIKMSATGNLNKNDLNKAVRMIPAMQPWYLRGASNKLVESTNLPKTYSEASRQND